MTDDEMMRDMTLAHNVRMATLEEAAKLIETGWHVQHPIKPAGVSVRYVPPDHERAAAIRALASEGQPSPVILPCPFCGEPARQSGTDGRGRIGCENVDCFGPYTTAEGDDAVVQWNARQPSPAQGWQTIETAPKDGTWLLLFSPDSFKVSFIAQWREVEDYPDGGAWWEDNDGGFCVDADPSHWMPLPAAPAPVTSAQQQRQE